MKGGKGRWVINQTWPKSNVAIKHFPKLLKTLLDKYHSTHPIWEEAMRMLKKNLHRMRV